MTETPDRPGERGGHEDEPTVRHGHLPGATPSGAGEPDPAGSPGSTPRRRVGSAGGRSAARSGHRLDPRPRRGPGGRPDRTGGPFLGAGPSPSAAGGSGGPGLRRQTGRVWWFPGAGRVVLRRRPRGAPGGRTGVRGEGVPMPRDGPPGSDAAGSRPSEPGPRGRRFRSAEAGGAGDHPPSGFGATGLWPRRIGGHGRLPPTGLRGRVGDGGALRPGRWSRRRVRPGGGSPDGPGSGAYGGGWSRRQWGVPRGGGPADGPGGPTVPGVRPDKSPVTPRFGYGPRGVGPPGQRRTGPRLRPAGPPQGYGQQPAGYGPAYAQQGPPGWPRRTAPAMGPRLHTAPRPGINSLRPLASATSSRRVPTSAPTPCPLVPRWSWPSSCRSSSSGRRPLGVTGSAPSSTRPRSADAGRSLGATGIVRPLAGPGAVLTAILYGAARAVIGRRTAWAPPGGPRCRRSPAWIGVTVLVGLLLTVIAVVGFGLAVGLGVGIGRAPGASWGSSSASPCSSCSSTCRCC